MKILLLYTYNQGLLSQFYQELSRRLAMDGFEVVNFSFKKTKQTIEEHGVRIVVERKGNLIHRYWSLFRLFRNEKPDLILSNFSFINPALLLGKLLGIKQNVAWFHTAYGHSTRHWFHVWYKKQCFRFADLVVTNSARLSLEMTTYYGVSSRKLETIPFWTSIADLKGHPIERWSSQTSSFKIGCPGRLVADKNHGFVLECLAAVSGDWELFIAGDGPEAKTLKNQTSNLGIEDRVHFMGQLSAQEMVTFYERMDLLVLPSLHEAFGLVFLEAIALGTPVLVSKEFGILSYLKKADHDLLENMIFDPRSHHTLREKIETFRNGMGLPREFYKELYLRTFNKDIIYKQILGIFTSLQ